MTTSHSPLSVRTVDFFLQRDSTDWGDEAERLRYYEAHSTIFQLTSIVQPIVAAVLLVSLGRRALVPCVTLWAVPLVVMNLGTRYLDLKGVRTYELAMRNLRRSLFRFVVPNLLPMAAVAWVTRDSSFSVGILAGAVLGAVIGVAVLRARAAKERRQQ